MNLHLTARHFDLTEAMKNVVAEKVRDTKFADRVHDAHVTLEVERHRHICEVVLQCDGYTVKATEAANDMYQSLDQALDKAEKQLKKHHDQFKIRRSQAHREKEQSRTEVIEAE